jgi:hypothetical protein
LTEKADDILSSFEKDLYNSQLKYRMIFVYKHFDYVFEGVIDIVDSSIFNDETNLLAIEIF